MSNYSLFLKTGLNLCNQKKTTMENHNLKVLAVDDAELVIQRLFEILNELECIDHLYKANSYEQAVELIKEFKPDIVLLDIQIPGKNGIELLSFIKHHYPNIITIMLTNMESAYYKDLCVSIGCNHFIDKSRDFEKITNIIASYMPVANY